MIGNYAAAETLVIGDEGRVYTFNPKDRGGPTKLGVTQRALSDYLGRPASIDEVKALTQASVKPIYKTRYWDAVRGDALPSGLDYFVFDSAVQHGPVRAIQILQISLGGLNVDGDLGAETLRAIAGAVDIASLIERASGVRNSFYRSLPDFPTFGTGWLNRLTRVTSTAKAWARKPALADPPY